LDDYFNHAPTDQEGEATEDYVRQDKPVGPKNVKFKMTETLEHNARIQKNIDNAIVELAHDAVNHPSHYMVFPEMEAIDVIRKVLSRDEFKGYLIGQILKYRLRAGNKDDLQQDIDKADWYKNMLFNEFGE
jgi:hypothetical protein